MPRKAHGHKETAKDPREDLVREAAELGRAFQHAIGAAVQRPEFREGLSELNHSLRGAAMKLAQAVAGAGAGPEADALKAQAEKVAKAGQKAGQASAAAWAKGLAAGLKTLADELEDFADKAQPKKRKKS